MPAVAFAQAQGTREPWGFQLGAVGADQDCKR